MISSRPVDDLVAELRALASSRRRRFPSPLDPGSLLGSLLGTTRAVQIEDRPAGVTFRFASGEGDIRLTCVLHHSSTAPLTTTEAAVAEQLCEGRTLAQIAALRGVSVNTIKSQVRQVFRKLEVDSRVALVRLLAP